MKDDINPRLIIGITGATGVQYGIRLLELLQPLAIETHLIMSKSAQLVRQYEVSMDYDQITALADYNHSFQDVSCSVMSGSFKTMGMIIAPCSMHTLAEIAHGFSSNALTRAADVILKDRRKLVLMVRESPLNAAHLENMLKVTHMGGIIAPPVPAFYNNPQSLNDIIDHSVGRALDLFDIDAGIVKRWK
jgi:flavin prenyltransferase